MVDKDLLPVSILYLILNYSDIFVLCESGEEFCREIRSLSSGEKYSLLKQLSKPPKQSAFPMTFTGGCNRSSPEFGLMNTPGWSTMSSWMGHFVLLVCCSVVVMCRDDLSHSCFEFDRRSRRNTKSMSIVDTT